MALLEKIIGPTLASGEEERQKIGPLDLSGLEPPVVVVPHQQWSIITEKALRFGLGMSPDVIAVHVSARDDEAAHLRQRWSESVEEPARRAGIPPPRLLVVASPFRRLFHPLFRIIKTLEGEYPDRMIAVIIPELVGSRWHEYLLHNQRATALKAALLLRGDQRVVIINVPWYLSDRAS